MIDTHAHLTDRQFLDSFGGIDRALEKIWKSEVQSVIQIATDKASLDQSLKLLHRFPQRLFLAAATHPQQALQKEDLFLHEVKAQSDDNQLIAIGETGLDYFHKEASPACQQLFFSRYIQLALQATLPLVIHCRDAFDDLFSILQEEYHRETENRGVFHCFTGTQEQAKQILDQGWYIAFGGIVTFKNAQALRDVVAFCPLDRLLLETDTPYLAPQSKRGQINHPSYLTEIANAIALIKQCSLEQVQNTTTKNAQHCFKITPSSS